jgi:hypothetical protein
MAGTPPLEPVSSVIGRLQFVSSSAPAIYLNEQLTNELFRSQLGAIENFTRTAGRAIDGGVGISAVRVGASTDKSEQVSYELSDPITKALLLHSALGGESALTAPADGPRGAFAEVIAPAHLTGVIAAVPPPGDELVMTVNSELDRQLGVVRGLGDLDTVLLPLLLMKAQQPIGSIIDRRWLRPSSAASYGDAIQVAFGLVEGRIGKLPFMTLIYMRPYL